LIANAVVTAHVGSASAFYFFTRCLPSPFANCSLNTVVREWRPILGTSRLGVSEEVAETCALLTCSLFASDILRKQLTVTVSFLLPLYCFLRFAPKNQTIDIFLAPIFGPNASLSVGQNHKDLHSLVLSPYC
jgi:hypothetical protein